MDKFTLRGLLLATSFLVPATMAGAEGLLLPNDDGAKAAVTITDPVAGKPAVTPVAPVASRLIPFAEPTADFQLTGEADAEQFTFRLDGKQVAAGGNLVLAYQNAVSVLPDDALMVIEVNGKPVGDLPVVSPFDFTRQKIALPAKLLREGVNTVRIAVSQHHRVDCSLEATYELWTRFSPELSGFMPAVAPSYNTFSDLYSAGRMEDGATEVRLILPKTADADMLNAASSIVQALTLYLGRQDVIVTVADRPGEGPGIDLFAGIGNPDPAGSGGMLLYAEAPYGVTVKNSADPSRAAVVFKAMTTQELASQLVEAVRGPMAAGLKGSRSDNRSGLVQANADQTFTLKDTGFRSTAFGGRLMRTKFDMVMPADFYAAEYGTLDLRLSAATAPGLDPSSQMLVRVNDKVVNSFPFRNTDGQNFNGKLIELPLRAFRPGVNKVELIAELPNAADKVCAPQTRNDAKPRYVLLEDTTFSVPPLARVARLPDLGAFSGNAYPYGSGKPFDIYLASSDSHSASAAMTVLARLAMTSGVPLRGNFRLAVPAPNAKGDALVISASPVEASNSVKPANNLVANSLRVDDHAAGIMKTDLISTAAIAEAQPADAADPLMQAFENSTADQQASRSWTARIKHFLASATGQFGNWLNYEEVAPVRISAANTLLTLVQTARADDAGVVTEIHAGSPEDLSKGIRRLADPAIWYSLNGGAALIEAKSMDLVTMHGQAQRFAEVTDQSVGNYRRIAAAWLSDNFQAYVAMVILSIGLFGAWLGKVVQRKGVRTAK
jgi:hypothetical protein